MCVLNFYLFMYFGCAGSLLLHQFLPTCSEGGLMSSCGAVGFSLPWRLLLQSLDSRALGFHICGVRAQ